MYLFLTPKPSTSGICAQKVPYTYLGYQDVSQEFVRVQECLIAVGGGCTTRDCC